MLLNVHTSLRDDKGMSVDKLSICCVRAIACWRANSALALPHQSPNALARLAYHSTHQGYSG